MLTYPVGEAGRVQPDPPGLTLSGDPRLLLAGVVPDSRSPALGSPGHTGFSRPRHRHPNHTAPSRLDYAICPALKLSTSRPLSTC